jgi:hypothetical protein
MSLNDCIIDIQYFTYVVYLNQNFIFNYFFIFLKVKSINRIYSTIKKLYVKNLILL